MKEKLCQVFKNKNFITKAVVVTALVLTVTILGATYAYQKHANELDNLLKAHSISGEIIENDASVEDNQGDFSIIPGANVIKKVQFKNNSDAAVFIRVAYAETWMDEDGALLAHNPLYATPNWTIAWTASNGQWHSGGDGWYYYKSILKAGDITPAVLNNVRFANAATLPSEYATGQYQLTFVMEMMQCSGESTVNTNALTATFGKTATVSGMTTTNGAVTAGTVNWN